MSVNKFSYYMNMELGIDNTTAEIQKQWDNNSLIWSRMMPPLRPSAGVIEIYKETAGDKIAKNVMILGSTPELRDLTSIEGNNVFVIDSSKKMYIEMSRIALKGNKAEKFVEADWREKLFENKIDIIVGDLIWWLLSLEGQNELLDSIYNALKDGGIFLSRFRIWQKNRIGEDIVEVVKSYIQNKNFRNNSEFRNSFFYHVSDIVADEQGKRIDRKKTADLIFSSLGRMTDLNANELKFLNDSAENGIRGLNLTFQPLDEVKNIILKKFSIKDEKIAQDYMDSCAYPILAFEKK